MQIRRKFSHTKVRLLNAEKFWVRRVWWCKSFWAESVVGAVVVAGVGVVVGERVGALVEAHWFWPCGVSKCLFPNNLKWSSIDFPLWICVDFPNKCFFWFFPSDLHWFSELICFWIFSSDLHWFSEQFKKKNCSENQWKCQLTFFKAN